MPRLWSTEKRRRNFRRPSELQHQLFPVVCCGGKNGIVAHACVAWAVGSGRISKQGSFGSALGNMTGHPSGGGSPLPDTPPVGGPATTGGVGGVLGGLFGGGAAAGDGLRGGLSDLIDSFTGAGHGEAAKSWVSTGANLAHQHRRPRTRARRRDDRQARRTDWTVPRRFYSPD